MADSTHDAEFTPSAFGGGWLNPLTPLARDLVWLVTGEKAGPNPSPLDHVIEPFQMEELAALAEELGATIRLA